MKLFKFNKFIVYSAITFSLITFTANAGTKLQNNDICFSGSFDSVLFKSQTNDVAINPKEDLNIAYAVTSGQPFEGVANNLGDGDNCFVVKSGRKNSTSVATWAKNTAIKKGGLDANNLTAINPLGRIFVPTEANFSIFGTLILKQKIGKDKYNKLICPNLTFGQYGQSGVNIWFFFGKRVPQQEELEINCYNADNNEEVTILIERVNLDYNSGHKPLSITDEDNTAADGISSINSINENLFKLKYK